MHYTEHDTPEVVARIERDLEMIRDTVLEADPGLRSLVLTGGFARGEGAVLDGAPQNDYDLVAIRGRDRPLVPYEELRESLEAQIGLHIDLAQVPAWRLPFTADSIFWYETAWRGRVLWGEDLQARIAARAARDLEPTEGLRLIVNRAAGLLLATERKDPHEYRIQAAKGLLAAFDMHMLAHGAFPPSQSERWRLFQAMHAAGTAPAALQDMAPFAWAYRFKVDPAGAPPQPPQEVWQIARRALLDAVPTALHHAGLPSLAAYAKRDSMIERTYYYLNARKVPGGTRLMLNPTGRVRVATIRLLEAASDDEVLPEHAIDCLGGLTGDLRRPTAALEALRQATLQ